MLEIAAMQIWYQCLDAEVGLLVRSNDAQRAKQALYRFRRESMDPRLSVIQIRVSPENPTTDLFLIKMGTEQKEN